MSKKVIIFGTSAEQLHAVCEKAEIKSSISRHQIYHPNTRNMRSNDAFWIIVNDKGLSEAWNFNKYKDNIIFNCMKHFNIEEYDVVFADQILNGNWKAPWIYQEDENHPPKGYVLVTDEQRKKYIKPDEYLLWTCMHKWEHQINNNNVFWSEDCSYAIPVDMELTPKIVEVTLEDIAKKMDIPVECLRIKKNI
jgi:hypothetical protein